jgi:hypothetical protein
MATHYGECFCGALKIEVTGHLPGVHVKYGETVPPMQDGLTKFNDFRSEFAGSGKTLPE